MKILKEETQYHHGSFKDLKTFLDKDGNPYTLIKSDYSDNKSETQNTSSKDNKQNNSNNQNTSQQQNSQNKNNSNSNNQSSSQSQANNNQNNQSDQNNNQNQNNSSQQNHDSRSQNQQKIPPDPNASYVDVISGFEYKWDPSKNKFMKVGKYRAK